MPEYRVTLRHKDTENRPDSKLISSVRAHDPEAAERKALVAWQGSAPEGTDDFELESVVDLDDEEEAPDADV